jgi:hypothetical protein
LGSPPIEMYLLDMDQVARENIAAAAAARHELGSGYDDVIAEGLIERIGAEIDKRVDARLDGRRQKPRTSIAELDRAALERRRTLWKGAAIGGAAVGLPALWVATASQYPGKGVVYMVIFMWVAIATGYGIVRWAHTQSKSDD